MFGYYRDSADTRDHIFDSSGTLFACSRMSFESAIGPAVDQGQTSECVCYALCGLKKYQEFLRAGLDLTFDPNDLYTLCKAADGDPRPGTTPRTALQIAAAQGVLASDGNRYKIASYVRMTSVADIKTAIQNKLPVLLGIECDPQSLSQTPEGSIAGAPTNFSGGHCVLAVGFDDSFSAFRIRNSWGSTWCDEGHFWLAYDYLTADPQFDAWTCVEAV